MAKETLVLAFDIERSGPFAKNDTIAIGAIVMTSSMEELDRFSYNCYFPSECLMDTIYWETFWIHRISTLNSLKYTGVLAKNDAEYEMIKQFQDFRRNWELYASENNVELALTTDNPIYDGGFINQLIFKYLPTEDPIPYSASGDHKWRQLWNTDDQQRGLLSFIDPVFRDQFGLSNKIINMFQCVNGNKLPPMKITHDHDPVNDAYTIAYDQQLLFGIRDGKYVLRSEYRSSV